MIKTNLAGVGKALDRINKRISKIEDIATTRALNIILDKSKQDIAAAAVKEYGVLSGSAKSHIKPTKATKNNKEIKLTASSTRSNLVGARKIKGGISFRKKGGARVKIKTHIRAGASKPFMIKAKAGGQSGGDDIKVRGGVKRVPVYVSALFNKFKDIRKRKVTTMRGSSIARMVGELAIESKDLRKTINKKFPVIYSEQLKKAKFTGSR